MGWEYVVEQHFHVDLMADPRFRAFIDSIDVQRKVSEDLPLDEQRALDCKLVCAGNTCFESVERIENVEIVGKDHHLIPVRIYVPQTLKKLPVIVYFHGGGWVFGSVERSDGVCRRMANHCGCIVASVDYRLAPENPFPKALDDCFAAIQWVTENASLFGGDPHHIIVAGESAGGNLAAAVALMARDLKGPKLAAQVLFYPVITSNLDDGVYAHCADQYYLTKDDMIEFWNMYANSLESKHNPYASLDYAQDLSGLPPAIVITAEHDPLCEEGEKYALRLEQSGGKVMKKSYPGLIHGFLQIPLYTESEKVSWMDEIGAMLSSLLQE